VGNVHAYFSFVGLFVFELGTRMGQTDVQTDGRTSMTRNAAY